MLKRWSAYIMLCLGSFALLGHGILPHHHHEPGREDEHSHHFAHGPETAAPKPHSHDLHKHADATHDATHVQDMQGAHAHLELESDSHGNAHFHAEEDAHDDGLEHVSHAFEFPFQVKSLELPTSVVCSLVAMMPGCHMMLAAIPTKVCPRPPPEPPPISTFLSCKGLRGPPFLMA
jgi:hypothetical protein